MNLDRFVHYRLFNYLYSGFDEFCIMTSYKMVSGDLVNVHFLPLAKRNRHALHKSVKIL